MKTALLRMYMLDVPGLVFWGAPGIAWMLVFFVHVEFVGAPGTLASPAENE